MPRPGPPLPHPPPLPRPRPRPPAPSLRPLPIKILCMALVVPNSIYIMPRATYMALNSTFSRYATVTATCSHIWRL